MRKYIILLSFMLTALVAAADQSFISKPARDFSLRDQFDRSFTLQSFSGRTVILMACDKKASKQNGVWRAAILDKYAGRLQTAGVADLRSAPFF